MSLVAPPSAEGGIEELSADPMADDLFAQALRDDSSRRASRALGLVSPHCLAPQVTH
jgi:hypothetical protein